MAQKSDRRIREGDRCVTTVLLKTFSLTFPAGTVVSVIDIDEGGYSIQDDFGNKMLDCGWSCLERIELHC